MLLDIKLLYVLTVCTTDWHENSEQFTVISTLIEMYVNKYIAVKVSTMNMYIFALLF